MEAKSFSFNEFPRASALILTIVLTSLLAIVGMMFVIAAQVDKTSTSSVAENKGLDLAVGSIVARLSQELVLDTPGIAGQEYYDYPGEGDEGDEWLASLEPYDDGGTYRWGQISDVTGQLTGKQQNIEAAIIPDYPEITLDNSGDLDEGQSADADGDGVADSKWILLEDISSDGKPIFAAVRVIDNGGMLNVNTGYEFDPDETDIGKIDGSSQMQINLLSLAERGSTTDPLKKLDDARFGSEPHILNNYIEDVVWRYNEPNGVYTPFDISDELKLRNRYILNYNLMTSRIEEFWENAYDGGFKVPRTKISQLTTPEDWFYHTNNSSSDPNIYDYRHISTTHNMDRIIDPNGDKMFNINAASADNRDIVYNRIRKALTDDASNFVDVDSMAAQIAVNLIDFRDANDNSEVTTITVGVKTYYGFEAQPFISEIGIKIDAANPADSTNNHFAVELYNPFNISIPLDDFILSVSDGTNINLAGSIDPNGFFVVVDDPLAFTILGSSMQQPLLKLSANYIDTDGFPATFEEWDNYNLTLKRTVDGSDVIVVDKQATVNDWFKSVAGTERYVQRDDDNWRIVYQKMDDTVAIGSLGAANSGFVPGGTNYNLALANKDFITIGEIALPLIIGPDPNTIGEQLTDATNESQVRIDLADPNFQQIFKYLTVMDPCAHGLLNETRIKGRININTAPWYVIAQLPWVSDRGTGSGYQDEDKYRLAQAIVAYRDKNSLVGGPDYSGRLGEQGFRSIGELNNVVRGDDPDYRIDYYGSDLGDLIDFPDLTHSDNAIDDFEERDVIFARISNLVAIRSDVFTAYILVRIGTDGPQKRVVAILDRSNVGDGRDKVKIAALHTVPDPR